MQIKSTGLQILLSMFCLGYLAACGGGGAAGGQSASSNAQAGNNPLDLADSPAVAPVPISGDSRASPVISGETVPAVAVGEAYEFQPIIFDPNGEPLNLSVENLPGWARFDEATGLLSGTPAAADVGTYRGIVIRVANSHSSTALPAFDIVVTQIAAGSAVVSWVAPEHNTDGSPLTDLAGFNVHFGRSPVRMTRTLKLQDEASMRAVVENLSAGPWYFAVSAVNSRGVKSALSGVGFKRIH